jgi:hypothetical protein
MQATKQNQNIINPKTGELNDIVKNVETGKNNQTLPLKSINPVLVVIIFIISLLVIVTLGVVAYIKKRRNSY